MPYRFTFRQSEHSLQTQTFVNLAHHHDWFCWSNSLFVDDPFWRKSLRCNRMMRWDFRGCIQIGKKVMSRWVHDRCVALTPRNVCKSVWKVYSRATTLTRRRAFRLRVMDHKNGRSHQASLQSQSLLVLVESNKFPTKCEIVICVIII